MPLTRIRRLIRSLATRGLPALIGPILIAGCTDGTEPLRPTTIELSQPPTAAEAGASVTPAPTFRILDQNGDPMAGIPVSITVTAGNGTIAESPVESAATALPVGQWTLGPTVGENVLEIAVDGIDAATLTIRTMAGPPAAFDLLPADSLLTAEVGTELAPAPRITVTDRFGNPVPDAPVALEVSGGEVPATVQTDSLGVATLSGWILGTASGDYTLTLTAGTATTTLTAIATPGPPAALELASGGGQSAVAGGTVPSPIRFQLSDRFGNGVPGVGVSFVVAAGGGTLRAASAETDVSGQATAPDWSLGLSAIPQRLRATAAGFSAEASASVQTSFNIEIRFFGATMSQERQDLFFSAANRIRGVVTGDLSAVSSTGIDPSACGVDGDVQPLTGTIDDLIIYATVKPIDGVGRVLASAGPCYIRNGPGLPVLGVMQFDDADVTSLQNRGTLRDVILHEMLHVLGVGIGLYWDPFLTGDGTSNPLYSGAAGLQGCRDSGGTTACTAAVPVENIGGIGTADSHWRESVFDSELMTGFAEAGAMPLSRITIGSLQDIGYTVNFLATDDYTVPFAGLRTSTEPADALVDRVRPPLFTVSPAGDSRPLGNPAFEP